MIFGGGKAAWGSLVCGASCGVCYALGKTAILKGYERTSVAFMTFCHAAGMILPCVGGYLFWQERVTLFAWIGILLTLLSVLLLGGVEKTGEEKKGRLLSGVLLGLLVFLASGGVMICQKLMGIVFPEEDVGAFNFYSFLFPGLLLALLSSRSGGEKTRKKPVLPFSVAGAVSLCVISFVMTSLAGRVPSVLLFPVFNGLGIVSVCVCSVFAFGERMTVRKALGIALGLTGLFFISLPA